MMLERAAKISKAPMLRTAGQARRRSQNPPTAKRRKSQFDRELERVVNEMLDRADVRNK